MFILIGEMNNYYVAFNRKYRLNNPNGWKRIVVYSPKDAEPISEIPRLFIEHWTQNKSLMGYAPLRGLSAEQCMTLTSLYKGTNGKLILGINRWGDITSYKILGE